MSDSSPPSDDDRRLISRRLLLSSPPGQFDSILADLRTIHKQSFTAGGRDLLSDKWAEGVRIEYEKITRREVLNDGDEAVGCGALAMALLSCAGEVTGGDGGEALAEALREEMGTFMTTHYSNKSTTDGGSGGGSTRSNFSISAANSDSCISIVTYAERVDLRNHYTGSWSAEYKIRSSGVAEAEMEMSGTINLVAHAFENGNVQMRSTVPLGPTSISPSSSASPNDVAPLARAAVSQIRQWEDSQVQMKLREMYDSVNDGMLKSLRRVLPVSRRRMDWKNLGGHRLVENMAERKEGLER